MTHELIVLTFYLLALLGAAVASVRAARLQNALLWLAAASLFLSLSLYTLGAVEVAVIELSVGAGLIVVFYVFVLNLVRPAEPARRMLVRPLALLLALAIAALLGWRGTQALLPGGPQTGTEAAAGSFALVFWERRALDTLLQLALLFGGALTVLGLIGEREGAPSRTRSRLRAGTIVTESLPSPREVRERKEST